MRDALRLCAGRHKERVLPLSSTQWVQTLTRNTAHNPFGIQKEGHSVVIVPLPIRAIREVSPSQTDDKQGCLNPMPIGIYGVIMRTNELHASAKQIGRSSGRSSVAAAAYRSGELLHDERTGLTHDYTKKGGVEYARVYTPYNAPEDLRDREKLWNAVEKKENRKNSTTAHELEIAFSHEFNAMQRREAGHNIACEIMRRYNVAVDIALHHPNKEGDERNFHAHILFTTRGFDESTKDGWSKNKFRDLSADKITVDGENTTRGKEEVKALRKFTADEMNRIAERDNLAVKTEHLSFEARGIDKEPTKKMGVSATQAERRGVKTERGDINREIKASNDNLGNTIIQLQDQKTLLILEQKRALLALEQERTDGEEGEGGGTWQSTIATFKKEQSFPFHQRRVEQVQDELAKAKGQLETMSMIDRMVGKKSAFETEIQAKETNLKEAQNALDDIKRKGSAQPVDINGLDAQLKSIEQERLVTVQRTAQYKQEQGEAASLQAQLENRNNIDKIIGAITGRTREQQQRIEKLQGNIKTYESDKRLEEIKQRQQDQLEQDAQMRQRDKDRSNDNKVEQEPEQDKTKEQTVQEAKQKYLADMAAEREEKAKQEAIKKGYDYQPMSERSENDMSLSKDDRKEAYLERMDKQREQEAAYKEKEREVEKLEYESRPENNPELSAQERQQAYLDRMSSERAEQSSVIALNVKGDIDRS